MLLLKLQRLFFLQQGKQAVGKIGKIRRKKNRNAHKQQSDCIAAKNDQYYFVSIASHGVYEKKSLNIHRINPPKNN